MSDKRLIFKIYNESINSTARNKCPDFKMGKEPE